MPTVVAIGATTAAVVMLFEVATSAAGVLTREASEQNMIVLSQGTRSEPASAFARENLGRIEAAPGVARNNGSPAVSGEYVTSLWVNQEGTGIPKTVRVRGLEAGGLGIHSGVRLAEGRFPGRGEQGVVVGRNLIGRFEGLKEGGALSTGRHQWPVVGVLDSQGASASEIWCDRTALMDEFHHLDLSVAYVTLDGPDARAAFVEEIGRVKGLEAVPEIEIARRRQVTLGMDTYIQVIRVFALLLALGAIFASLNALHGSFLSRRGEFATLMAMGYRRLRVLMLALQESLLVSAAALLIGVPLAFLVEGRVFSFGPALFYSVHVDGAGLLIGGGAVLVIGLLGGLAAALQLLRMNVLVTLRDA